MDIQKIVEASKRVRAGTHSDREKDDLCNAVDLLFCPEPLTLDAAVQVMGREPISAAGEHWNCGDDIWLMKRITENHVAMIEIGNNKWWHPTIGQFACLVAAARMGEQA